MSDYIKRENVLNAFSNAFYSGLAAKINEIPSEDVEPVRHGGWKPFDRTYGRTIFACSVCGDCTDVPTEMGEPIFGYCPNCGAKMDKEDEQ